MGQLLHLTSYGLFDIYTRVRQCQTRSAVEFHDRFFISGHRRHEIRFRLRQIAVRLQHQITCGSAEGFLLLFDVKGLLGQIPCLASGFDPRPILQQGKLCIANFDPDLILQLLQMQLGLPIFQLGANLVGLGSAVAQRNVEIQPNSRSPANCS